jgi:hypothetical protein
MDRATSDLAGIPVETLQRWLREAQEALHDLATGGKAKAVLYGQGDGTKSVTFTAANMAGLRGYISELKAQLGIGRGRRALEPIFGPNTPMHPRGRWVR